MKKLTALLIAALLMISLVSCAKDDTVFTATTSGKDYSDSSDSDSADASGNTGTNDSEVEFIQLDPPEKGEQIAVLTTNYGVIKLRLFPEEAPLAVENFKTLIDSGYYNGVTFHRVINDFMIQGGDPTATGSGGESCWGEDFDIELSKKLFNFRGALCMANTGMAKSNSSQFYIVQAKEIEDGIFDEMTTYGYPTDLIPDAVKEKYKEIGGFPSLDANYYPEDFGMVGYTVFGQVFEGMDVVDAIAAVETDSADKPISDVIIEKAELTTYNG